MLRILNLLSIAAILVIHTGNIFASGTLQPPHKTLRFSCLSKPGYADYEYYTPILIKAFKDIGYGIEFVQLSPSETIKQLKEGSLDGDCGRTYQFNESMGLQLVKVYPPLGNAYLSSWALRNHPNFDLIDKASLQVAYDKQAITYKYWLKKLGYKNIISVDLKQGLDLLTDKKIDLFYAYESSLSYHIHDFNEKKYAYMGPIMSVPTHVFLQAKHKKIAKQIEPGLKRLLNVPVFKSPYSSKKYDKNMPLITLACSNDGSKDGNILKQYYEEVFEKLGYRVKLIHQPLTRETYSLRKNLYDGSCARDKNYTANMNIDLLTVDAPVAQVIISLWSDDPSFKVSKYSDIKNKKIAYLRGMKSIEIKETRDQGFELIPVGSTEIGLKMLAAGRVDGFLGIQYYIGKSLDKININKPLYYSGSIQKMPVYLLLSKEHKNLIDPLKKIILDKGPVHSSY